MRTPTFLRVLTNALVVAILLPFATSCNKEEPTVGVIKVVDAQGAPVVGAMVKLFADPAIPAGDPTRLDKESVTDGEGVASFDYSDFYEQGQSGFAVLDIMAMKDTLIGEGIIKIVEEETRRETVVIEPVQ
jgi:hypothetical protein